MHESAQQALSNILKTQVTLHEGQIDHSNKHIHNCSCTAVTSHLTCPPLKHTALIECRTDNYVAKWCDAQRRKPSTRPTQTPIIDSRAPETTRVVTVGTSVNVCIVCRDFECFLNSQEASDSNQISFPLIGFALLIVSRFILY